MNFHKTLKLIFISFLCFYLSKCSYDFSDDYYVDIKIPSINDSEITILNFNNDEVINDETTLEYIFKGMPNQITLKSEVFLDNEKIYSDFKISKGSFTLFPSRYNDGKHIIKITHTFTSGSGSLSDQIQKEILTKTQEFSFEVKRNPSTPPSITDVIVENGSITVKWDQINGVDYDNAFLNLKFKYKEIQIPLSKLELESKKYIDKTTVLFEANSNSAYFDSYSQVTYSIGYSNQYTKLHGSSRTLKCDPNWVNVQLSYVNNDSYKLVWKKHPLYNNFEKFDIYHGTENFKASSLGGEYIINLPYAIGKKYYCVIKPIKENSSFVALSIWDLELDPNTFGLFDYNHLYSLGIVYNPINYNYYSLIAENKTDKGFTYYIYEYSGSMEFIRKKRILEDSYADSYYFTKKTFNINTINNNLHVETSNGTYEIDYVNLNIINSFVGEIYDNKRYILRGNILYTFNISNYSIEVKNILTNTLIHSQKINLPSNTFPLSGGTLSNDGKYVFIPDYVSSNGSIYKINGGSLIKISEIKASRIHFYDHLAIYQNNGTVTVLDIETNITTSFDFGVEPKIDFDLQSQKVLVQQNGYNAIFDLNTNQLKTFFSESTKHASIPFSYNDIDYIFHLLNNRLIHTKGIYFDNY
ncbi:YncE family protein [Tenacibaculum sp.]|uniref:YncE family protein n=1 Tax=Tenacibaculum sp. TaxID=1906242 RepID=UPI003D14C98F